MTIACYDDRMMHYACEWFDGKNQKSGNFSEAVLEKASPVTPYVSAGGPRRPEAR
jgi:uncharacterized protein YodC (DUF2158 family)